MKSKSWIIGYSFLVIIPLVIVASMVVKIDPYFHYHKPLISEYYYELYNQRSQNDGITRNFDYEGLITGTSMTENFNTTEAEDLFGCSFIKIPYSGGTYKEINDSLKVALAHNDKLKIIIRGLDMGKFKEKDDALRDDLGEYPAYLYNENPFDDVQYLFNRDVFFTTIYGMITAKDTAGFKPGITAFDAYSNWMEGNEFGVDAVFPDGIPQTDKKSYNADLTEEEKEIILENVTKNVTDLAREYPDVTFYYFFTPYSAGWWQNLVTSGILNRQLQMEKIVIEEILKTDNIKLYSFNCLTDITTDLDNYKDYMHYGEWVNSLILRYMKDGKCLLTKENYKEYLQTEQDFYWTFDYDDSFKSQQDRSP